MMGLVFFSAIAISFIGYYFYSTTLERAGYTDSFSFEFHNSWLERCKKHSFSLRRIRVRHPGAIYWNNKDWVDQRWDRGIYIFSECLSGRKHLLEVLKCIHDLAQGGQLPKAGQSVELKTGSNDSIVLTHHSTSDDRGRIAGCTFEVGKRYTGF